MEQKPSIGRIVHYVSHGTPVLADGSQAYASRCRAAVITEVLYAESEDSSIHESVGLCVLNPTGQFFNQGVPHDEDVQVGGTWHWPEIV